MKFRDFSFITSELMLVLVSVGLSIELDFYCFFIDRQNRSLKVVLSGVFITICDVCIFIR